MFLPIDGYFSATTVHAGGRGRLITTMGHNNNATIDGVTSGLRRRAEDRNLIYANAEERVYSRIAYRDILNREHEEYYLVMPVYGGVRISDEEGRAQFEAWRSTKSRRLSDLSVDKILEELSAMANLPCSE